MLAEWRIASGRELDNHDHTLVMGVVNVTPDSFSDGGRYLSADAAISHGLAQIEAGADIVDVGGESTRPGAQPVSPAEEIDRVRPVVAALAGAGAVVSIDTSKAEVAAAAVDAGAAIVNDVTALGDPEMAGVVSAAGAGIVLMHMQGQPQTMQADPSYDDVVAEVTGYLRERVEAAVAAGIDRESICIDPGIGFGKLPEHNLALLAGIPALAELGRPVLVGASRKAFLDRVLGGVPVAERDAPTIAAHTLAIVGGATVIRVHEVVGGLRSARVADAILSAAGE